MASTLSPIPSLNTVVDPFTKMNTNRAQVGRQAPDFTATAVVDGRLKGTTSS